MSKVMLVEDDNNLREIYGARLLAEGYEIVSAKDGEEALALAVKEKPDLIITDVMMPKISGFDMLDILRSTPETKNTKVIMMTALSQAEDKSRADKLGADRYLVKSQVTLEDVAKAAKEVLGGEAATPTAEVPSAAALSTTMTPVQSPVAAPAPAVAPAPVVPATPAPVAPATPAVPTPVVAPTAAPAPVASPATTQDISAQVSQLIEGASNIETVEVPSLTIPAPATTPSPAPATQTAPAVTPTTPSPVAAMPAPTASPTVAPTSATAPISAPVASPVQDAQQSNHAMLQNAMTTITNGSAPSDEGPSGEQHVIPGSEAHAKTSIHTKVIQPINDISKPNDELQKLLAAEETKAPSASAPAATAASTPAAVTAAPVVNDITPPVASTPAPATPPASPTDEMTAPEPTTITPSSAPPAL